MKYFASIFLTFTIISTASAQLTCPAQSGTINIAGSSTVEPIAVAWANQYQIECSGISVNVAGGTSTTGAGRVCGRLDDGTSVEIGNMSREWRPTEASLSNQPCKKYQCLIGDTTRYVTQIDVAIDGITVVLQNAGLAGTCITALGGLTIDQLRWIYSDFTKAQLLADGWDATSLARDDNNETSHNWSEIDPSCPIAEIKLSSPSTLSGTFDFFSEKVFSGTGERMARVRPGMSTLFSDDDNVLVNFVSFSSAQTFGDGISFVGFAFYINDAQILYGVPIKAKGATNFVTPTKTTIEAGTYVPFTRRLYMNVLDTSLPTTGPLISVGFSQKGIDLVKKVGYIPIPEGERAGILACIGRDPPLPPVKAPAPTKLPTRAPTKLPTRAPTKLPTRAPTKRPTRKPTKAPTRKPTKLPTRVPTRAPFWDSCWFKFWRFFGF